MPRLEANSAANCPSRLNPAETSFLNPGSTKWGTLKSAASSTNFPSVLSREESETSNRLFNQPLSCPCQPVSKGDLIFWSDSETRSKVISELRAEFARSCWTVTEH